MSKKHMQFYIGKDAKLAELLFNVLEDVGYSNRQIDASNALAFVQAWPDGVITHSLCVYENGSEFDGTLVDIDWLRARDTVVFEGEKYYAHEFYEAIKAAKYGG